LPDNFDFEEHPGGNMSKPREFHGVSRGSDIGGPTRYRLGINVSFNIPPHPTKALLGTIQCGAERPPAASVPFGPVIHDLAKPDIAYETR
jgi:hypothetical protein